jgi:hypothetical protein
LNRNKIISEYQRVNNRFEDLFLPRIKRVIRYKAMQVIARLNSGGIEEARRFLHSDVGNEKLAEEVRKLYKIVGLRHAMINYSRMLAENGRLKGGTPDYQTKGFGFSAAWTNYILNYLNEFLLEKITFNVAATTRTAILAILSTSVTEGWSTDQTIQAIRDWPGDTNQAAVIVRTEVNRAANVGAKANSVTLEYQQQKEWISAQDFRVRGRKPNEHANHWKLNGTKIDAEDTFQDSVNGDLLDIPGDPKASAASTVNCRCVVAYTAKRDSKGNLIPKRQSTSVVYPNRRQPQTILI